MGDDGLELILREIGEGCDGQKDDGTEPANHRRRLQPLAFAEADDAVQAEAALQRTAYLEEPAVHRNG